MEPNKVSEQIIAAAIEVYRARGPGPIESTYEACLQLELVQRRPRVERQKEHPVEYRGMRVDCGCRIDLLAEGPVIVELKSVSQLAAMHEAQLLSYLRLSGRPLGLLINFNVRMLKDGIRGLVNALQE